eukprot:159402_1
MHPFGNVLQNEYIPRSHIIYFNNFNNRQFINKFQSVYDKYFTNDAYHKLLFECMVSSYELFIKYVNNKKLAQININHFMRQDLMNWFGQTNDQTDANTFDNDDFEKYIIQIVKNKESMEINTFYFIFDECCEEMLKVLNYAFLRFEGTELFKRLMDRKSDYPFQTPFCICLFVCIILSIYSPF